MRTNALHERPFCAHPNACDTQTHSLSAAPPLSGFTCLPAFALVCPLASGCDHLLQYFCLRACPSAPLNLARSGLNALDRVCLNLFCLACLPDLSAFERLLANQLSRVWLWHMHTASSAQHTDPEVPSIWYEDLLPAPYRSARANFATFETCVLSSRICVHFPSQSAPHLNPP